MSRKMPELERFSELSPDADSRGVGALFRSAKAAPEDDLPRVRWRLRSSLRQRDNDQRLLHIVLITSGVFLTGGVVGAMVRPYWEPKHEGPVPSTEKAAKLKSPSPRKAGHPRQTEPEPVAMATNEPLGEEVALSTPPAEKRRPPARLAWREPSPVPEPPPTLEPAATPAPPSAFTVEQTMLGEILISLRTRHDALAALALLDEHDRRFPTTGLGPELAMLRVEALLGVGRKSDALALLDRLSLSSMPNRDERLVLRGELRAAAGRWREAQEDFGIVLFAQAPSGNDVKRRAIVERALWGRASTRSHLGDEAEARADLTTYMRRFPSGRFAEKAAALLRGSP